jgi:hypothetical protein
MSGTPSWTNAGLSGIAVSNWTAACGTWSYNTAELGPRVRKPHLYFVLFIAASTSSSATVANVLA